MLSDPECEFEDEFEDIPIQEAISDIPTKGLVVAIDSASKTKPTKEEISSFQKEANCETQADKEKMEDLGLDFGEWIGTTIDSSREEGRPQITIPRQEFTNFETANEEWDDETWEEVDETTRASDINASEPKTIMISMENKEPNAKRRKFTGLTREQRIELMISHRVTLLSWVGVLLRLNRMCNTSLIQGLILSHIPTYISDKFPIHFQPGSEDSFKKCEENSVKLLLDWWNKTFQVLDESVSLIHKEGDVWERLQEHAAGLNGCRDTKWALLVVVGRCIGLRTRLVLQVRAPVSRKSIGKSGFVRLWSEYQVSAEESWKPFPGPRIVVDTNQARCTLDYVLGISLDGVEDVTSLYVSDFLSRHYQLRQRFVGVSDSGWWGSVLQLLGNVPPRSETLRHHVKEKMPTTLAGFKAHPLLVLERHIPKSSVLLPGTASVALFRGEKVYPRSALSPLKSKQAWWLLGREIISKHFDPDTTLFPEYSTQVYTPSLLGSEKIPRNKHGSFDLFQPSMLPEDAAHITIPDAATIARKLGLDYARAVVGFQHGPAGALPVEQGIVVSKDNASLMQDALSAHHSAAVEKETHKRYTNAVRNWKVFARFLNIKLRLQEEYGE